MFTIIQLVLLVQVGSPTRYERFHLDTKQPRRRTYHRTYDRAVINTTLMMDAARRSVGIRETTIKQNTGVNVTDTSRSVENREGMVSEGGNGASTTENGTVPGPGSGGGTETVMTVLGTEEKTTKDPPHGVPHPQVCVVVPALPLVPLRLLAAVPVPVPTHRLPLYPSRTKPNPTSIAQVSLQQRPTLSTSPTGRGPCSSTTNPPRHGNPRLGGDCMCSREKTRSVSTYMRLPRRVWQEESMVDISVLQSQIRCI